MKNGDFLNELRTNILAELYDGMPVPAHSFPDSDEFDEAKNTLAKTRNALGKAGLTDKQMELLHAHLVAADHISELMKEHMWSEGVSAGLLMMCEALRRFGR